MATSPKLTGVHYALLVCVPICVTCGLGWLQARKENDKISELLSARESAARNAESEKLTELNHEHKLKLDAEITARTRLEEQLGNAQLDLKTAELKNRELRSTISIYQQALEAAGIASEITKPAIGDDPALQIDGVVEEIKAAKRQGGSELVEISVGGDQGLKKQDEMTVYRPGIEGGQRHKFLARIVIVDTKPDKAIGQVIERTRNGVIRKGDKVTSKL